MKIYVIGKPVKHSMSPIIHNYWLKKYSKSHVYEKKEVCKDSLKKIIEQIKTKKIVGVNVTIPYKKDFYNLLKNLSSNAKKSKAVNTLYLKDDNVYGENTDGIGYCEALRQEMNYEVKGKNILVLGSGGASFGIISELINRKASKIIVSNRTKIRCHQLIENFRNNKTKLDKMEWQKIEPSREIDLIINTTSIGMKENEQISINTKNLEKKTIYSDIIYNPTKTRTMKSFEEKGFLTQNGLGMLIFQAAEAFRLWFGINLTKQDINEAKRICETTS